MKYPPEVLDAVTVLVAFLKPENTGIFMQGIEIPLSLVDAADEQQRNRFTPAQLMELWNTRRHRNLREVRLLTSSRRRHCAQRLKEFPERSVWEGFMDTINRNSWLLGMSPGKDHPYWKANFDWFIRPGSVVKYVEGGYSQEFTRPVSRREQYGEDLERRSGGAVAGVEPAAAETEINEDRPEG